MARSSSRKQHKQRDLDRSLEKLAITQQQQSRMPQPEHYHPFDNKQSKGQYPSGGNAYGRQGQQGPDQSYSEPPPPYQLDYQGTQSSGMPHTPSNSGPFHHGNPFHSGSMRFPPTPARSVSDDYSDSETSEVSAQTGSGPGIPHFTPHTNMGGPAPTPRDKRGKRPKSHSAMPDSGYDSDCTVRGGPNTGCAAPRAREREYERSMGSGTMSVAGSDSGWFTEDGSDTNSVFTTDFDGNCHKPSWDLGFVAGYKRAYELGRAHGFKDATQSAEDSMAFTLQKRLQRYN